jgi:type IV pilus assembly protein PilE
VTMRRRYGGVTLVELLIVVMIVSILGLIAVPSYRAYTMRAHRTEAKSALLQLAANQERFYLQNNSYSTDLVALGFPLSTSEYGVYTLTIPVADTVTYQATATPTPGGGTSGRNMTADAECARFTIDAQGLKTATPDPENRCW